MRKRLIELLRQLEKESGFENRYTDFFPEQAADYSVHEYLDFPDFRYMIQRYNDMYPIRTEAGLVTLTSGNSIRGELKRMEADGLIMIGTQTGNRYATTANRNAPDMDDPMPFTTESIVLTTQGKSSWVYMRQQLNENPIPTVMSLAALVVSIAVALFKN